MAPRRSARVSAAAQKAAPEKPTEVRKERNTKAQRNGVSKKRAPPAKKQTAKGKKASTAELAVEAVAADSGSTNAQFKVPEVPATPKRRRDITKVVDSAPPSTPPFQTTRTGNSTKGNADGTSIHLFDRLVDPHRTNATLLTPHGSHITAYPNNFEDASPSKTGLPRPTTTAANVLDQAIEHLIKVDARLAPLIEKHPCPLFSAAGLAEEIDPFNALTSGIIGQQVSGAAAKSIKKKFVALFNNAADKQTDSNEEPDRYDNDASFPTPEQVAKLDIATLRTAGLSQRKAEYIQGLAEKFAAGELSARMLLTASDEEVLEKLIAVRGLGRWSVEMFSCFGLKRMDVFSTGDLGVQRGMAAFVGRDVNKLKAKGGGKFKYMSEKDMIEIAAPFSPYRSLFMWYMWRVENVDVDVMQNN